MHEKESNVMNATIIDENGVNDISIKPTLEHYIIKTHPSKTMFIDTVVSGRASSTILNELKDYHAILIVDENGTKLQEPYKSHLKKLESEGHATLIYVNKLYTEDRGPIFLESNAIGGWAAQKVRTAEMSCGCRSAPTPPSRTNES